MKKNQMLLSFLHLGIYALSTAGAYAQRCPIGYAINQSERHGPYETHVITNCVRDGIDPDRTYLRNLGEAFSRTKVHAILPRSQRSAYGWPNVYEGDPGHCDPDDKRAGGESDNGALNPCDRGNGSPLLSMPPQQVNIPICNDCTDCGVGLLGALLGAFTGGTPPNLSGTFSARGNISSNGCVSGSIGICGLGSIGGSVCPSSLIGANGMQQPTTPTTNSNQAQSNNANANPSYIRINAPSLQIATPKTALHNGTTNYLPDGGLLRVCASGGGCWDVDVPVDGHVVIDAEGVLRVGCPTCPQAVLGEYIVGRDGMATGAAFDLDAEDFTVTLVPNSNTTGETIILADENLVQGSGPRGINSLNTPVQTQQVVSVPAGNNTTQRVPNIITVQAGQNNTRLPTRQTIDVLQQAQLPNATCRTGGTSCFSGSFAPLAPTENVDPATIPPATAVIPTPLLD